MTTVEYPYYVRSFSDGKKRASSTKIDFQIENPHVGAELTHWLEDVTGNMDDFWAVAYILEEYGDEIADDLEGMDKDDLRDYVVDIEFRRCDEAEEQVKEDLKEELGDMDADDAEAILEDIREAKGDD